MLATALEMKLLTYVICVCMCVRMPECVVCVTMFLPIVAVLLESFPVLGRGLVVAAC